MNIYERALAAWGKDLQKHMVAEECAELIKAICKGFRSEDNNILGVIEEAVDVSIMLNQLWNMLTEKEKSHWTLTMKYKLERLEERLKGAK